MLRFLIKVPRLYHCSYFDRYRSVGKGVDSLTSNDFIRKIRYGLFSVLGVSPYRLPSHYLGLGRDAIGTVVGNPVHISGGNKRVADLLVDFILLYGGQLVFQEKVQQIVLEDTSTFRVVTDRGVYSPGPDESGAETHPRSLGYVAILPS
jgi:phytoene dehydrogenase-like protein